MILCVGDSRLQTLQRGKEQMSASETSMGWSEWESKFRRGPASYRCWKADRRRRAVSERGLKRQETSGCDCSNGNNALRGRHPVGGRDHT